MIHILMRDGRVLNVEDLEFTVVRGAEVSPPSDEKGLPLPDGVSETFRFTDVDRVALIDGGYEILGSKFGGMPIRIIRWTDTSDVRVDMPLPLEAAAGLGDALKAASVIEVAKAIPTSLLLPPGR